MDLLRALARPALATPFILDGIDAVTRPKSHVERIEAVTPALERVGLPPLLHSDAVMLTRVSGAVAVVAGLGLATGRAPRSCAATLAVMNVPLALVNNPVWLARGRQERKAAWKGLSRAAAVGAGLAIASVDRAGKPSLSWRYAQARQARAQQRARAQQ